MACPTCSKKRQAGALNLVTSMQDIYPMRATDISVIDGEDIRKFKAEDWDNEVHKLLIFIPEAFTPVCQTEIGAINKWYEAFKELGCELIVGCTDSVLKMADWYESEELLKDLKAKTFSSYALPSRLGLVENGRVKRSSVFITKQGDVVKQEHFDKVGRSFAELHRMLFAYNTGSYCGEGWKNPEDGFLDK